MLDPETDPSRRRLLGGLCAGALLLPSTPGRALTKADHAPFVTTPHEAVQRMLALAGTGPEDIVYDLGSGDGRIVIAAARDFGARAVGIEFDYRLNAVARVNAQADGVADRVRFLEQDLFDSDFSEATVVTLFLREAMNLRLKPLLLQQLQPGTPIVSYRYGFGEWPPEHDELFGGERIRLWTTPSS